MAKKKKSAAASGSAGASKSHDRLSPEIKALLEKLDALASRWYDQERAGIALIESFQSALLACRSDATAAAIEPKEAAAKTSVLGSFSGSQGNWQMDPLLAEELFVQVKDLTSVFEAILLQLYALHEQARAVVQAASSSDYAAVVPSHALVLTPLDYLQCIGEHVMAFEAEFQHIEALVALITFETSSDQLRTLVISWTTSPFLEPSRLREFRQRQSYCEELTKSK